MLATIVNAHVIEFEHSPSAPFAVISTTMVMSITPKVEYSSNTSTYSMFFPGWGSSEPNLREMPRKAIAFRMPFHYSSTVGIKRKSMSIWIPTFDRQVHPGQGGEKLAILVACTICRMPRSVGREWWMMMVSTETRSTTTEEELPFRSIASFTCKATAKTRKAFRAA